MEGLSISPGKTNLVRKAAALGGLLLGFVEIFVVALGSPIGLSSSYRDLVAFTLLLVILVIKPTGLFGVARRQKL